MKRSDRLYTHKLYTHKLYTQIYIEPSVFLPPTIRPECFKEAVIFAMFSEYNHIKSFSNIYKLSLEKNDLYCFKGWTGKVRFIASQDIPIRTFHNGFMYVCMLHFKSGVLQGVSGFNRLH